jgi:hypothetical protein
MRRHDMNMKKLMTLLFFVSLFVLLVDFVSAQVCLDDQVIMRISATQNAHGEFWNGAGSYATKICYDFIFGNTYTGANARTCNSNNKVLRLNGTTNAHAEIPTLATVGYVDVCYGDLTCKSVNGDIKCDTLNTPGEDYKEIVSLSSNINAHLGVADSYTSLSNKKICCSSASASTQPKIDNAMWRYFDGTPILENTLVCPNTYIISSVRTNALIDGMRIWFQVYDDDGIFFSPDKIYVDLSALVSNNQANYTLNLTDPSVRAHLKGFLPDSDNLLELYFEANTSSISGHAKSKMIKYSDNVSLCNYDKPKAIIDAPVHKGVYFTNLDINFKSGCTSRMGPVRTEWTITQGADSPIIKTDTEFLYRFNNAGQANVKLKCTDLAGRSDVNETQILIVASSYVLAYINKPEFNSFVVNPLTPSGPYFPQEVRFSASDSFVVEVTSPTSPCEVKCLGGSCPSQTQNSPSGCNVLNPGGPIAITGAPGPGDIPDYNGLNFNWTFWGGSNNWRDNWALFEGAGVYTGKVPYSSMSNAVNDKYMSVKVIHTSTGKDASFERQFTLGRCLNNGNSYYDSSLGVLPTDKANNACKGGDSVAGTADDCCSAGLKCMAGTSGGQFFCQIPAGKIILKCEDFERKDDCNANTDPKIPRASYGPNPPPECTLLECLWDQTVLSCALNVTTYNIGSEGCGTGGTDPPISCVYTTSTSDCISGRRTITYTKSNMSHPNCPNKPSVDVPCGSLSFELSFFGIREFVISIILIASIYLLFNIYRIKRA